MCASLLLRAPWQGENIDGFLSASLLLFCGLGSNGNHGLAGSAISVGSFVIASQGKMAMLWTFQ
jgi:hypothetical protein